MRKNLIVLVAIVLVATLTPTSVQAQTPSAEILSAQWDTSHPGGVCLELEIQTANLPENSQVVIAGYPYLAERYAPLPNYSGDPIYSTPDFELRTAEILDATEDLYPKLCIPEIYMPLGNIAYDWHMLIQIALVYQDEATLLLADPYDTADTIAPMRFTPPEKIVRVNNFSWQEATRGGENGILATVSVESLGYPNTLLRVSLYAAYPEKEELVQSQHQSDYFTDPDGFLTNQTQIITRDDHAIWSKVIQEGTGVEFFLPYSAFPPGVKNWIPFIIVAIDETGEVLSATPGGRRHLVNNTQEANK